MGKQIIRRAQGCLLGQLAGDSLGSLVEFKKPEEILRLYPQGVRDLADGGVWNTLACGCAGPASQLGQRRFENA